MFDGRYIQWREARIGLIEELFGKEFFRGKKLLELGCGHGHIGRHFRDLGAVVTFAEGRKEHLDIIKTTDPTSDIIELDQDNAWLLLRRFDIVIHWGVLYHLNNWKQDLICSLLHAPLLFLESEVCDSDDPNFEIKVDEYAEYDQSLHAVGSRPSAAMIEAHLESLGATFTRYDDPRLNADIHTYDWKLENTRTWRHGMRRFWVVKRAQ